MSDAHMSGNMSVRARVLGILHHPEFTDALIQAMDTQLPRHCPELKRDQLREDLFEAMARRVAQDVNKHPLRDVMFQLLKDASQLHRTEFYDFLDFVHSCLVSHFKGELAELLAWPLLQEFAEYVVSTGLAPPGVEVVPGSAVQAKRSVDSAGWYKGADALFVVRPDALQGAGTSETGIGIVGAAEIKSSRVGLRGIFEQLAKGVRRFRLGLRLHDAVVDRRQSQVLMSDKRMGLEWIPLSSSFTHGRFCRLAIRPVTPTGSPGHLQRWGPRAWVSELPYPSCDILEAAYRFAVWYVSLAGNEVYCEPGANVPGRVANPHLEMTFEESAQETLREGLYHFAHDEKLLRKPAAEVRHLPRKELRRRARFMWLYNSLCYGHGRATGDEIQVPEQHPDLPRAWRAGSAIVASPGDANDTQAKNLEELIEVCRGFYSHGKQAEARRALEDVKAAGAPPAFAGKVAWLEGMIAYRDARFEDALRLFPGPESGDRDSWWTRDQVMSARLNARGGRTEKARDLLETLLPLTQWPYAALPVEHGGVIALAWLIEGDLQASQREAELTIGLLEALRADIRSRQERGMGSLPNVSGQTVHMGMFDLVAVLVALGRVDEAMRNLTRIRGLDGWEPEYFARDPLLAPLYADPGRRHELREWEKVALLYH